MTDTEYSHDSDVKGFDKVIEELHKKYCGTEEYNSGYDDEVVKKVCKQVLDEEE